MPDALTDTMLAASCRLKDANEGLGEKLGEDSVALVHDVIAKGLLLKDIAAARGDRSADAVADLSHELRVALDVLAIFYGLPQ